MQIGEKPNEVYNRREQVHKFVEMEQFNQDHEEEIVNQPLIQEGNNTQQNFLNSQQQQQQVGCLSKLFGILKPKQKSNNQEEEYKPTELKDHYNLYDEQWFIDQRKIIEQTQTPTDGNTNEVIHIIRHDDTLEGLELQYGVSAYKIRNYNNLQTNDIFYLKQIRIPNPSSDFQKQEIDLDQYMKELKLHRFLDDICQPEDRTRKVALFYLDLSEWNYQRAAQEYLDDYKFELEQKKQQKIPHKKVIG